MLWHRLKTISRIEFESKSIHDDIDWNVSGNGKVVVECPDDNLITFSESGSWTADSGLSLNFSNRYRWHRTTSDNIIRLQHLRYGDLHPVELVELMLQSDLSWKSLSPHICKNDAYRAEITIHENDVLIEWTITGPAKSELLSCIYS